MADADYVSNDSLVANTPCPSNTSFADRLLTQSVTERRGGCRYAVSHPLRFEAPWSYVWSYSGKAEQERHCIVGLTLHSWITELKKKRTFRKFSYRGIDLDQYVHPQIHFPYNLSTPINYGNGFARLTLTP